MSNWIGCRLSNRSVNVQTETSGNALPLPSGCSCNRISDLLYSVNEVNAEIARRSAYL
jgi:hypothetical protein